MRLLFTPLFFACLFLPVIMNAQDTPAMKNEAFAAGESLTYNIYYNWGAIWLQAGEATFSVQKKDYKGKAAWYFTGTGSTFPKYDWIYKVRDKFESWADTSSLKPFRFVRDQKEGSTIIYESAFFNFPKKKVYDVMRLNNKAGIDSTGITDATIDVMTAIYWARCIDFTRYKANDTIPITLYLENKIYPVYIRYVGKEDRTVEGAGTFHCIKFRPLLIEGTIFKGGEGMTVWVTDDKNRIPVYVETPIVVGSIKVYITKVNGLRNPMTAKIK
jgi:hypothetical protein